MSSGPLATVAGCATECNDDGMGGRSAAVRSPVSSNRTQVRPAEMRLIHGASDVGLMMVMPLPGC
jgi:hypothetical protein